MPDNTKKANAAPRCQYIRLNDQPCTQPALKDNIFCRFHELVDHPLPTQQIPFVEDATTLQVALMQVIRSLQLGQINRATAGTILYALQIAAQNLKHFSEESGHAFAQPNSSRKAEKKDEDDIPGPSLAEILLERLQIIEEEDAAENAVAAPQAPPRPSASAAVKPESGTIDKLEACAPTAPPLLSVIPSEDAAISARVWRLPRPSRGTCIVRRVTRYLGRMQVSRLRCAVFAATPAAHLSAHPRSK